MKPEQHFVKGRGAQINPGSSFSKLQYESLEVGDAQDEWECEPEILRTHIIPQRAKSIVNKIKSEDLPMALSANPYQGCEHGCVYCYARSTHEYWGFGAGLDFETKIIAKTNAAELLRQYFDKKSYQPEILSLSMNTDCYQPVERQLKLTRQLLEVCLEYRNPVSILTKNALVLRDMDILQALHEHGLVSVSSSITCHDENMRRKLEPRTSSIATRLKIIESMAKAGIPTGLMFAPIIPGLNDAEMYSVLKSAADAGAERAGYTIVRLNGMIAEIFRDWLEKTYPDRAEKVWHSIESCHGGKVSDSRAFTRIVGEGHIAGIIRQQFKLFCQKLGLNQHARQLNHGAFRRPAPGGQLSLF
ncbi:MAG TPA: PA0069 family radical SAM protein [Edaphocola sp.]|nr:PA0069 family radical SAM protein [Edaphocola sp.]